MIFNAKAGVTVFFVLSGFLISRILFNERVKESATGKVLSSFYARRALRIFPIYYLTLFVVLGFGLSSNTGWSYAFYFQNIQFAINNGFDGVNGHLWSLAVEEQFYLFWPLIMLLTPKKYLLQVIVIAIALGPISRILGMEWFLYLGKDQELIHVLTPTTLDSFGIGALLAYYETFRHGSYCKFTRSFAPALIGIVGFILYVTFRHFQEGVLDDIFHRTVISMWCVFLIPLNYSFNVNRYSATAIFKALVHIGKVSYGIYLFHPYVKVWFDWFRIMLMEHVQSEMVASIINASFGNKIQFLLLTVMTIALSTISWKLIEAPINGLKRLVPYS